MSHTGDTVYLHAQTTQRTVIQRDAIQINVLPIESFIPCLYATQELASYASYESNLPLSSLQSQRHQIRREAVSLIRDITLM